MLSIYSDAIKSLKIICFFVDSRCLLALSLPPTSTVHSDSKSNMAGRKNDRELITLARPNKVPALQARLILILDNVEFHL